MRTPWPQLSTPSQTQDTTALQPHGRRSKCTITLTAHSPKLPAVRTAAVTGTCGSQTAPAAADCSSHGKQRKPNATQLPPVNGIAGTRCCTSWHNANYSRMTAGTSRHGRLALGCMLPVATCASRQLSSHKMVWHSAFASPHYHSPSPIYHTAH